MKSTLTNIYNILTDPSYEARYLLNLMKKQKNRHLSRFLKKKLSIKYGVHCSLNSIIGKNLNLPHPSSIIIGEGCRIGDNVTIYQGVTLGINNRNIELDKNNIYKLYPKVEDNVVIYANSTIIGGVTIGKNSIIGANSLVISNVEPNSIYVGSPARRIGENKL